MDTGNQETPGTGEIREITEEEPIVPNKETELTQQVADFYKQFAAPDRMIIHNREQRRLATRQNKQRSKRKRKPRK
jgi:hypothetical protein